MKIFGKKSNVLVVVVVMAAFLAGCSNLWDYQPPKNNNPKPQPQEQPPSQGKIILPNGQELPLPSNLTPNGDGNIPLEDILTGAGLGTKDEDGDINIDKDKITTGDKPTPDGILIQKPDGSTEYFPIIDNRDGTFTLDTGGEDVKIPAGSTIRPIAYNDAASTILKYTITDVNGKESVVPVIVKKNDDGTDATSAKWSVIKAAAKNAGVNVGNTAPGGSTVTGWSYSSNSSFSGSNTANDDTTINGGSYIEPTLTAKYPLDDGSKTSKEASFDDFKYSEGGKKLSDIFANANGGNTSADTYQAPSKANTPAGKGFTGWKVTTPDGTETVVTPSQIASDTAKYPAGTKIEPNWEQLHVARLPNNETMEFTEFTRTSDGFYIANTEVTRGQWLAVMGPDSNESDEYSRWGFVQKTGHAGALDMPMNNISWFEAIVFCNKMSMLNNLKPYYYLKIGDVNETNPDKWGTKPKLYYDFDRNGFTKNEHKNITGDYYWNKEPNTGWNHINHDWDNIKEDPSANGYRLPTLEQWKYAAKGGEGAPYSTYSGTTGTDEEALKKVAWYTANSDSSVQKVGEKGGDNPVRDMTGNVWEWLWDHDSSNNRLFHGGAYNATVGDCNIGKTPLGYNAPHTATQGIGFRIIEPIIK